MAIGAVSGASANLQTTNLGMQDFLKILVTQLSYQDPLKPLDNQAFISQMAQFTSLDQTRQLNDKLAQLLSTQSSLQSVGLIGKTVEFNLASGGTLAGKVTALSFAGATPELTITTGAGQTISGLSLSQITSVR